MMLRATPEEWVSRFAEVLALESHPMTTAHALCCMGLDPLGDRPPVSLHNTRADARAYERKVVRVLRQASQAHLLLVAQVLRVDSYYTQRDHCVCTEAAYARYLCRLCEFALRTR